MTETVIISRTESAEEVLDAICRCLPGECQESAREAIINAFAGQWVYFPKALLHARHKKEILDRLFTGETRSVLCREFHISRSTLHRMVVRFHINARIAARL